jgi:hypothetical protein
MEFGIPIHFGLDLAPEHHERFHNGKCGMNDLTNKAASGVFGYLTPIPDQDSFLATFESPTASSVEHLEVKDARQVTVHFANTN